MPVCGRFLASKCPMRDPPLAETAWRLQIHVLPLKCCKMFRPLECSATRTFCHPNILTLECSPTRMTTQVAGGLVVEVHESTRACVPRDQFLDWTDACLVKCQEHGMATRRRRRPPADPRSLLRRPRWTFSSGWRSPTRPSGSRNSRLSPWLKASAWKWYYIVRM